MNPRVIFLALLCCNLFVNFKVFQTAIIYFNFVLLDPDLDILIGDSIFRPKNIGRIIKEIMQLLEMSLCMLGNFAFSLSGSTFCPV